MNDLHIITAIILSIVLFIANSWEIFGFYAACEVETERKHVCNNKWKYFVVDEESKMILWKLKVFSLNNLGEYWSKPICTCPICMSSLHSLWIWIPAYIALPFTWILIPIHLFYIFALAGFNKLITSMIEI